MGQVEKELRYMKSEIKDPILFQEKKEIRMEVTYEMSEEIKGRWKKI